MTTKWRESKHTSHIITEPSRDDEAKYFPLWENCKNQTSSLCSHNIWGSKSNEETIRAYGD